jgi:chorismate mutase
MRAMVQGRAVRGGFRGACLAEIYDGSGKNSRRRGVKRCAGQHDEAMGMDISDWRMKIDELDEQIVRLISERAEAARAIGDLKHKDALPVYEPGREQAVFDHVKAVNPGPLADAEMVDVYQRIIDVMRTLQRREG